MSWDIKSKAGVVKATVDALEYSGKWLGECSVTVSVESPTPINFEIGDWLEYRGERFEINYDPSRIKSAPQYTKGDAFKYDNIKLNSLADELTRCDFLDVVMHDNNIHFTGLPKFSFYAATVKELADRIQANLNRAYPNQWTVEVHPEYADKTDVNITADNIKVWDALAMVVDNFGAYFTIKGRHITIGTAGLPIDHVFKYGKNKGLYEIAQDAESDQSVITRLRAYGSTRNLPHRYYNSLSGADGEKLIPDNMAVQNLMLPDFPYSTQDPYIDSANVDAIGVREGSVFFDGSQDGLDEIYPSLEGMTAEELKDAGVECNATGRVDEILDAEQITDDGVGTIEGDQSTPEKATFKLTLKDLGFDINDHLTTSTATISFKSGMLGGREFEIVACKKVGNNYEIELNRVYDNDIKLWFPYSAYNASEGDRFVLLNIEMPDAYIKAASIRLLNAAKEYLKKHDYSRSVYSPKVDEIFMARQHDEAMASNGKIASIHDTIKEGMQMLFTDDDLNVDASIVIDTLTIKEGSDSIPTYEVVLKEEKTVGTIQKIQNQIDSIVKSGGGGQGSGGYTAQQIRSLISAYGGAMFLSKLKNDRSVGKIASDVGVEVGEFVSGASGAMIGRDASTGKTFAEVDELRVRVMAQFEQLDVAKVQSLAGEHIITPGGGVKIAFTETLSDRILCFYLGEQDGVQVAPRFVAGDMAICKQFDTTNNTTHYYWRKVLGTTTRQKKDDAGNLYNAVILSASDCDKSGTDYPMEGDTIVQLGNASDSTRQSAIIISTTDTDAPSIKLFSGINTYSLENKDVVSMGYDRTTGKPYFRVYGDAFLGDKTKKGSYLEYNSTKGEWVVKAKLNMQSTLDGSDDTLGSIADKANNAIDKANNASDSVGNSVVSVQTRYRKNTSTTTAPTKPTLSSDNTSVTNWNSWTTTAPTRVKGEYLWSITIQTNANGIITISTPICLMAIDGTNGTNGSNGADGTDGADGVSVTSITAQYYLSSSREALVGGEWLNEADGSKWQAGYYWWVRNKITYSNGNVTYTEPVCVTGNDGASGDVQLLRNSAFIGRSNWTFAKESVAIDTAMTHDGYSSVKIDVSGLTSNSYRGVQQDAISNDNSLLIMDFDNNSNITASVWAYTDSLSTFNTDSNKFNTGVWMEIRWLDDDGATKASRSVCVTPTKAGEWQRFSLTYPMSVGKTEGATSVQFKTYIIRNGRAWISQPQLEYGSTATPWRKGAHDLDYIQSAIRDARGENGSFDGGLILASLLRLGFTAQDGSYKVMAGLNGQAISEDGSDIALFLGGDMKEVSNARAASDAATTIIRMDGTGYFSNGNIRMTESGIMVGNDIMLDADGMHLMSNGKEVLAIKNQNVISSVDVNLSAPVTTSASPEGSIAISEFTPLSTGQFMAQGYYGVGSGWSTTYSLNKGASIQKGGSVTAQATLTFALPSSLLTSDGELTGVLSKQFKATAQLTLLKGGVEVASARASFGQKVSVLNQEANINLIANDLDAGVYTLKVAILADDSYNISNPITSSTSVQGSLNATARAPQTQQNLIGSDGLQLAQEGLKLVAKSDYFGVLVGEKYGFRITTANGFQKYTNGAWTTANI